MYNSNMEVTQIEPGRPALTTTELENILHKLEPHIKAGLSVPKACNLEDIPVSTVYKYINENVNFMERIEAFKGFKAKLISNIFMHRLLKINDKIAIVEKIRAKMDELEDVNQKKLFLDMIEGLDINGNDWGFLQWLALNDKSLRDEYGARQEITGKDGEPVSSILDKLEKPVKTDYAKLGLEARRQMVALDAPIQNQEQTGGTGDVPTEHNATTPQGGESGEPTGSNPQS